MTREILPSDPTSTFTNTGAAGINRLVALDDLLLVDNIGRNFEIIQVAEATSPVWIQRALYDVTVFPDEDNLSILDSDVHGAFLTSDGTALLVGNHFGRVRCFDWPFPVGSSPHRPSPAIDLQLPGDTERVVFDGMCFITSSPRGAFTSDPARPGIFISEPVPSLLTSSHGGEPRLLDCRCELADWGVITALAFDAHRGLLAIAAGTRLGLVSLTRDNRGTRLDQPTWETHVESGVQWLAFDGRRHLLAGGHDGGVSDEDGSDWNACRGGTLRVLTLAGSEVARFALPDTTAWGYGSDPIVFSGNGERAYVVDRFAGLHAIDLSGGRALCVCEGLPSVEGTSLGIGHVVRIGRYLYAGFSRGGYQVFRYRVA